MARTHRTIRLLALPVASVTFASCGSDPVQPDPIAMAEVAGAYSATTLTGTEGGETTDFLAEGFDVFIQLTAEGQTGGTFVIPGEGSLDLTGTWTFQEGDVDRDEPPVVTLDHTADTFLRDMEFEASRTAGGIRLEAERTFQSMLVRLVLDR